MDKKEKPYAFNGIFGESDTNMVIFESLVKPNLENVLNGYNSTFFAYGITSSGKTHTIFGPQGGSQCDSADRGICYLSMDYLFKQIQAESQLNRQIQCHFSYLEIYNENVRDLLSDSNKSLNLVEDPFKGVVAPELKEFSVSEIEQVRPFCISLLPLSRLAYAGIAHRSPQLQALGRQRD